MHVKMLEPTVIAGCFYKANIQRWEVTIRNPIKHDGCIDREVLFVNSNEAIAVYDKKTNNAHTYTVYGDWYVVKSRWLSRTSINHSRLHLIKLYHNGVLILEDASDNKTTTIETIKRWLTNYTPVGPPEIGDLDSFMYI